MTTAIGPRTDEQIQRDVTRSLQWDPVIPSDKVEVTVARGQVTLHGELDWQHQRAAAERTARRTPGVLGVSNLISVRPVQPYPEDLKQRVEDALTRGMAVDGARISVETDGDRVILRGSVRSWSQRREAERVTWLVPDVSEVENQLTVAQ